MIFAVSLRFPDQEKNLYGVQSDFVIYSSVIGAVQAGGFTLFELEPVNLPLDMAIAPPRFMQVTKRPGCWLFYCEWNGADIDTKAGFNPAFNYIDIKASVTEVSRFPRIDD